MELTYDDMVRFMDNYFADYNKYAADPETLPKMLKYYIPDIQLYSYTLEPERPFGLDKILRAMRHPGLHEEFKPNYYVVDTERKVVVVQMQNKFTEIAIQKSYPPKELSVHYHLLQESGGDIKISKILFFTEVRSPDDVNMMEIMKKYREKSTPEK